MTHRANTKKQASMPPCKPSNEQSPGSIFQQGDGRCNSWGVEENSLGCSWHQFFIAKSPVASHVLPFRTPRETAWSLSGRNQKSLAFLNISKFQTSRPRHQALAIFDWSHEKRPESHPTSEVQKWRNCFRFSTIASKRWEMRLNFSRRTAAHLRDFKPSHSKC